MIWQILAAVWTGLIVTGAAVLFWGLLTRRARRPDLGEVLDNLHSELKAEKIVREARHELAERLG
ncbi:MAG TPA: hypothetical protein VJ748_09555, partial [Vitreimonas sp.]|nr:hypothetical protein [Vitreimonas sp.]